MSEITEFFVRHYGLVINNRQELYNVVTAAALAVVRDSDITRTDWLALSVQQREGRYAQDIGAKVIALIQRWVTSALPPQRDHAGAMLIREVMVTDTGDVSYGLGCLFLPDDALVADLLADDDEDPTG